MRARKGLMDERADAFLALPGGIGTLEELFEVWVARGPSGSTPSRSCCSTSTACTSPLRLQLDVMHDRGFLRGPALAALVWASTLAEALDAVEAGLAAPAVLQPLAEGVLEAEPQ